ncbi:hypothetical protein EPN81_01330 [Patescibacteria group bacterium]|nr:MAG: hypothetical protein EPN81_01330 [Patescibacteria group bacterium]
MARFFLDHVWYFITVPTNDHEPIFHRLEFRGVLLEKLQTAFRKFSINKYHFSIMSDHYHILIYVHEGAVIPKLLHFIHGGTSFQLHLDRPTSIWGEYHVYVHATEELLDRVAGYVVGNPIKHGEVKTFDALLIWPFSSFSLLVEQVGRISAQEMVHSTIALEDADFSVR